MFGVSVFLNYMHVLIVEWMEIIFSGVVRNENKIGISF